MNPTEIIIHHSATARDTTQLVGIDNYHRDRDWGNGARCAISSLGYYVQYHYYIAGDGTLTKCAEDNEIRWHAGDENGDAIGICLAGYFDDGHDDMPSDAQKATLTALLAELMAKHSISVDRVYGHRFFSSKTCPGLHVTDEWISEVAGGGDPAFAAKYEGRVIIAVEDHGRKWYVYGGRRYEIDKAPEFEAVIQAYPTVAVWMSNENLNKIIKAT